jgi:hypothetical protein
MIFTLHSLLTLGICATVYASQEQVIVGDHLHQNQAKRVAIIGQSIKIYHLYRWYLLP